ncbi:MAG: outer membrane lipoprotein-sorting protein [Flavobacteriaceae bacterium]|nr:outer membrane lipoprotein-sorting protein [Flavobacteriaceae bacterium]MEE2616597.1 outer membrane lipoprotein-sorting protein [Bacteroidota bacterium]|tara:strand:+ start:10198 stop:10968 length:771 start_codon:yes stop_codon:yes gene_type:complete
MKMLSRVLVLVTLICSYTINAQTVDEIIDNYFENTGGVENWEKIEGVKMNAKVNQGGMEIPIEIVQLKSGKMMTTINFQGQSIKQGVFDGEVLWSTNFMTQKAEKSDEESTNMVKNEMNQFPDPFLNYKEKGFTAELVGTETVDGSETFKIKLTTTPNIIEGKEVPSIAYYFFDNENFVPIQVQEEIKVGPGKGMVSEIKLSDYQEAGGIYMPFSMTQGVKGQPGAPINMDKIEINPTIDDSEFAFPEEELVNEEN